MSSETSKCLTCGNVHAIFEACPETEAINMQDSDQAKAERGGAPLPFPGHNRRARRKMAKRHHLFKDREGVAWRTANQHMKDRRELL